MGLRYGGIYNGMHPMHTEAALGGGNDVPGGSKQDASEAGTPCRDGQGNSVAVHNSGNAESSYRKGSEEAK